jgi:hypothetical protein
MMFQQQVYGLLSSNDQLALELQIAADKSYRIDPNNPSGFLINSRVGPPATFSRASGATEIDSTGRVVFSNENYALYSNEIILNRGWALGATTSTFSGSAPLGGNAYIIAETTDNALHNCAPYGSTTNVGAIDTLQGMIYTGSIFVKKVEGSIDWIQISMGSGGFGITQYANFNIANGTVGNFANLTPGTTPIIESYPDGWYRVSIAATATANVTNSVAFSLGFINNINGTTRLPAYAGNPANQVLAAMAQFQRNSSPGPYILTTTSRRYSPSFYHDPATFESKGLYTEESRTNIIRQSEIFGTTWTTAAATVSSNVAIAPSGDLTADRIIENTTNAAHGVTQTITYTAVPHTFSIYAKAGTRNWIRLGFGNAGADNAWFNLQTGEIGTVSPAFAAAASFVDIQNAGNNWWRCSVTRTPPAGALQTYFRTASADANISYTGNGTGDVYVWGAQLEVGAFPTRYIPTTNANSIRAVDVCDINGTGFAEMYNPLEGTLCVSATFNAPVSSTPSQMLVDINDTTDANRLRIFRQNTTSYVGFNNTSNSITDVSITTSTPIQRFTPQKYAVGFKQNDFVFYANNALIGADNDGAMPLSATTLTIGDASIGVPPPRLYTNGVISSIRYYRRRLPNPKLEVLSFAADADADAYIIAIEAADGAPLEASVAMAYQNFVIGCKADGIWDAIKSSCILVGARTLQGALVPLKGTAPTNYAFISDDYDRLTGLKGNGSTKYLDTNRNNTVDPQNNRHKSVYVTALPNLAVNSGYIGAGLTQTGADHIGYGVNTLFARSVNVTNDNHTAPNTTIGFLGTGRGLASSFQFRAAGTSLSFNRVSETPHNQTNVVFGRDGVPQSSARISFYSIGESLNLAALDSRVSTLMSDLSAAIL